ncbi:hypothetical protein N7475_007363 [Penicillium sp. IBT 31633x]|nr:hypothetical protein N7475_007363 [Penicillium sp. IBT 31633x]
MTSRQVLLKPIHALLEAFTNPDPTNPNKLLTTFTTLPSPLAYEHGLSQLAPFLGRPFTGQDGIAKYFDIISSLLSIETMAFEPDESWVVDESCMAVALRGKARFVWKDTREAWDEAFVYRIKLAVDNSDDPAKKGRLAVCEYHVWADTGAAYLARLGKLGDLLGSGDSDAWDLGGL